MTTTSEYITRFTRAISKGERGFPGPPGPVSGGVYPAAGIPLSTGIAWGSSYSTSGSGTVVPLTAGPTFTGTVTMGTAVVIPNGGTVGQAAGPLLTFDDSNNYLEVTGCSVGINTVTPLNLFTVHTATNYNIGIGWVDSQNRIGTFNDAGTSYVPLAIESSVLSINTLSGGKVGIGVASPAYTLDVTGDIAVGGVGNHLYFDTTGTRGAASLYVDNDYWLNIFCNRGTTSKIVLKNTPAISFETEGSARMTLTNTGLGIGTIAPNAKIESLSTTEQLRLSYDTTHYTSFTVASSGAIEIKPMAGAGIEIDISTTGDFSVVNGATTNLYFDTSTRRLGVLNATPAYTLDVSGTAYIYGKSYYDDDLADKNFTAGFAGTNWQIKESGDAEFGNVLIRGGLNVYELIINRLHYQNGGLIIGAGAGKIGEGGIINGTKGSEVIEFEDPNGAAVVPFTVGSIVMTQNVDINRTSVVKKIVREVDSIAGTEITFKATAGWTPASDDVGVFAQGDEVVAIGHVSTASLQNSIYLTATDANNPYMAVFTTVDSYSDWLANARLKVMVGNLAKIASETYGDLVLPASPGYGFFSDNCYLSGKIVSTSGKIGGFTISSDQLAATNGDSYISYIDADGVFSWARMNSYCYSQQSTPVTLSANPYYVVALDHDSESTLNLPASGLPGGGQSTSMVIIHAKGTGLGAGKYHIQGNGYYVNRGGVQASSFDLDEGEAVMVVWDPRQGGQWYVIG